LSGRAAAVAAAQRSWKVFPCRYRDKRPAVDRWEERAISDPVRVGHHFPDTANPAVATGPSRLVVFDLDTHNPLPEDWQLPGINDGRDVFAQIIEWAGQPWPVTYMVLTPTGGWHLYFTAPDGLEIRNSAGKIGPLVDVRAVGGYVLAAGSVIDERAYPDKPECAALVGGGRRYEVIDDCDPVPLPGWLATLALGRTSAQASRTPAQVRASGTPAGRVRSLVDVVRKSRPGDRTGPLVWAAYRVGEMAAVGQVDAEESGELLVRAAVEAGIRGGERYARQQVGHVLGVFR
jgi:hypothetical protein